MDCELAFIHKDVSEYVQQQRDKTVNDPSRTPILWHYLLGGSGRLGLFGSRYPDEWPLKRTMRLDPDYGPGGDDSQQGERHLSHNVQNSTRLE